MVFVESATLTPRATDLAWRWRAPRWVSAPAAPTRPLSGLAQRRAQARPAPHPGRGRSRPEPPRAPSPPAPPRPVAFLFPAPPATNPLPAMSVELQEALLPTSAEGTARKPAARCPPRHPSGGGAARRSSRQYSQLVAELIRKLGERGGSSLARI